MDRNGHGDFLVSGRHTSTIYLVAGLASPSRLSPRSIIWRLGGRLSNFTLVGFNFSKQHDARFHPDSLNRSAVPRTFRPNEVRAKVQTAEPHLIEITFFDNAHDGVYHTAGSSKAVQVTLDLDRLIA